MKKWFIRFLFCVVILFLSALLLVPRYIFLSRNISVSATRDGLYRSLTNEESWKKWWPGNFKRQVKSSNQNRFVFNEYTYTIDEIKMSSLIISIVKNDFSIKTSLHVFPADQNTLKLVWEGGIHTSANPFKRIKAYTEAKRVNNDIKIILQKMQSYLSKDENVYGINIRKAHVVDSILIFKNVTLKGSPETGFIYNLINDLKTYITNNSAHETGFPMLNINTMDSINYLVKVAIPVDKILPSSGDISHKWMLGGGNILVAEVKGGNSKINKTFTQLEAYVREKHYVSPAIPFQSLITDRSKEPDSNKWVTRIYYPIMHY